MGSRARALTPLRSDVTEDLQGQLSPWARPGDFQGSGLAAPSAAQWLLWEGPLPPWVLVWGPCPAHHSPTQGHPTHSWPSHSCVRAASGCRSGVHPGSRSGPGPWSCHGASPSVSPPAWHSYIAPLVAHRPGTQTDRHRQTQIDTDRGAGERCSGPSVLIAASAPPTTCSRGCRTQTPGLPEAPGAGPGHRSNLGP